MLGKGWFPAELGGLDRYYRSLLEHLEDARGVVIGPAPDAPTSVAVASDHSKTLAHRFWRFRNAAHALAGNADVIDAHFALYAALPVLGRRLRGKPLVVHFQGPWADENVSAGDHSWVRTRARRRLERLVYRRADVAITLTSAFRQILVERYGVAPWNVQVHAPGVDVERFHPGDRREARRRLGVPEEAWVAVCVRRLVPRMGVDVLLDAWDAAASELPENSRLLIAGDGPLTEHLAHRAGNSVRLLGRLSDDMLVELYRAADVNVVPTIALEGFGLVVLEAAACGTPSIVTDAGGLPEAVAGLDSSLVVQSGNAGALASRLTSAAAGRLPERDAVRRWATAFSWPDVASRLREVYVAAERNDDTGRGLRIVYVDHVAQLSGAEIALLRMLPFLSGVSAHVILAEDGPLVGRLHRDGISVEVLPMAEPARDLRKDAVRPGRISLAAIWHTVRYVVRLARRLRQLEPDLVHTNSLKAGVYGNLAARLAGVPSIWHVRDRIDADYLPRSAVAVLRPLIRWLPRRVITNSQATMATVATKEDAVLLYSVIPEVTPLTGSPRASQRDAHTVGMVGRITRWKGQHVFLEAFAKAFDDGTERAIIVGSAMFGDEEKQYAADLRDQAERLGISDRVEFRGFQDDVNGVLAEMDIFVHASVTAEPFGQVILEAMASRVPVIATRGGGPSEIINDGVDGLLYEPGESEELAALLRMLARDEGLRSRVAQAGYERARDFGPDAVSEKLMAVYAAALTGNEGSSKPWWRRSN
jgi:glycosyltransferase involved in cell wall biosynthesis